MSHFNGIKETQSTTQRNYLIEGLHKVRLERLKQAATREGKPYVLIEFTIMQSTSMQPGTSAAQFMFVKNDMFLRNFKQFMEAVHAAKGKDLTDITSDACDAAFEGDGTSLRGTVLDVNCDMVKTRRGTDFTRHYWKAPSDWAVVEAKASPVPSSNGPDFDDGFGAADDLPF